MLEHHCSHNPRSSNIFGGCLPLIINFTIKNTPKTCTVQKNTLSLPMELKNNGATIPESDGQTLGKIERLGLFLLQFS